MNPEIFFARIISKGTFFFSRKRTYSLTIFGRTMFRERFPENKFISHKIIKQLSFSTQNFSLF